MKTKIILFILFLTVCQSCSHQIPDEELTSERKPYTDKEIRLDGYYFGDAHDAGTDKYIYYLFFYSNGVVCSSYGYDAKIKDFNEILKFIEKYRDCKDQWGIFQIENNNITEQSWHNSVESPFGTYRMYSIINRNYKIINDTTIVLVGNTGYITSTHNDYYYFKKFSPKPDCTNLFIK